MVLPLKLFARPPVSGQNNSGWGISTVPHRRKSTVTPLGGPVSRRMRSNTADITAWQQIVQNRSFGTAHIRVVDSS